MPVTSFTSLSLTGLVAGSVNSGTAHLNDPIAGKIPALDQVDWIRTMEWVVGLSVTGAAVTGGVLLGVKLFQKAKQASAGLSKTPSSPEKNTGDAACLRNGERLDKTRTWTHPSIEVPQITDLTKLPALSLGKGHEILIDFGDPEIEKLFSSFEKIKTDMSEGDYEIVAVLQEVWAKFRHQPDPSADDLLHAQSQRGNLHGLSEIVSASGATKEKAILLQLAFQYLGIPSELYHGIAMIPGDVEGVPGVKSDRTYWVVARPDGESPTIFCPSVSLFPVPESDPGFRQFSGLPVHRAFSDASRDETKVHLLKELTRAPDRPEAQLDLPGNTRVQSMDELYKLHLQKELQLRFPTVLGANTNRAKESSASLAKIILEIWKKISDIGQETEFISLPPHIIDTSLASLAGDPEIKKNAKFLKFLENLKADDQKQKASHTPTPQQTKPVRAPKPTIPLPSAASVVPPPTPASSSLKAGADAADLRVQRKVSDEAASLQIKEALFARYPLFQDGNSVKMTDFIVGRVYQRARKNKAIYSRTLEDVVRSVTEALASQLETDPANSALEKALKEITVIDAIHAEIIERYPVFEEDGWKPLIPKALTRIFSTWRMNGSPIDSKYPDRLVIPEDIFEDGFGQFRAALESECPNEDPKIFEVAFDKDDQGRRADRWTNDDSFSFSGVYNPDSVLIIRNTPQFREIISILGTLSSLPEAQILAQDLASLACKRNISVQDVIEKAVLELAKNKKLTASGQRIFENLLSSTQAFRGISEAFGVLAYVPEMKQSLQMCTVAALKPGMNASKILRQLALQLGQETQLAPLQKSLLEQLRK